MNSIMNISCLLLVTLIVVVSATPGHPHRPVDHYHEPNYKYGYGVHDGHTGDFKHAQEVRHGGWTQGSYSLLQPDGITRTVNYVADPWNGFRAHVHNGWGQNNNNNLHHG